MIDLKNSELIYLEIDEKSAEFIRRIRNNKINVLRQNKKISKTFQKKYFKNFFLKSYKDKNSKISLYTIKFNKKIVGYGGLTNIDYLNLNAEVSFLLDPAYKEYQTSYKNIFSMFLSDLIKYSKILKLKKIYTETFYFRRSHITILEKYNFQYEGLKKKHYFKSGRLISSVLHGLYL